MPILEDDIQVVSSAVMDDVPEGGGAPSGVVVVDGASNGIFEDVTDLDAANGNVSLRKTFLRINTPTTDKYMGANVIVAAEPGDPLLSMTLFQSPDFFATRTAAVSRLESYLSAGGAWNGYLYGLHVAGQKIVQFIQRVGSELPKIGAVFALVQDEGLVGQTLQYVRVKRCTYQALTFDDGATETNEFVRWVVSCEIDAPLVRDFKGYEAGRQVRNVGLAGRTIVRTTIVADAARYYGIAKLVQAAAREQSQVKVASIFTQLVPSSEVEVPIVDAAPNGAIVAPVRTATGEITVSIPVLTAGTSGYLGGSIMPGTLRGASAGNNLLTDKGDGSLADESGQIGSIDYQNGIVSVAGGSYGGDFAFAPAAYQAVTSESASVSFTAESRPGSIALSIIPPPPPGTLSYTYISQGKRYVLRDDGSGALRGDDPAYGAGKLNLVTGGVTITMGALPDAPSLGVLSWAPAVTVSQGYTGTVKAGYPLAFGVPIAPAACTLSWNDGQARTASISAAGVVSGAATGRITWATGEMVFEPAVPVPADTVVSLTYKEPVSATVTPVTLTLLDQGTSLEATLSGGCAPRAFRGQVTIITRVGDLIVSFSTSVRTIEDDGAGGIDLIAITSAGQRTAVHIGTIVYATGVIRIDKNMALPGQAPIKYLTYDRVSSTFSQESKPASNNEIQIAPGITGVIAAGTATATEHTVQATVGALRFDLPRGGGARFVSGSINLVWGGRRYVDRAGRMVHTINAATGAGVDGGGIDYQSGVFTPSDHTGISTTSATLASSAEQSGLAYLAGGCFLTPVSPVRAGQLSIVATLADGATLVSATFASTGYLVSDHAVGLCDYTNGIAQVWFRSLTEVPGVSTVVDLTDYHIPGVSTIHAVPALADSFRFNCVGYSFLPVDASVMGIDPVRLPSDGRVPIFTDGGMVVVHNTQTTTARTVANGDTIDCGRTRLARAIVRGADGQRIKTGFTADLDAGVLTITNTTGWAQPVRVEHRIEDFVKVLSVDINGTLTLARKLSHDFPQAGSGVSSCMILGDLKARVSSAFDQKTWSGQWSDALSGDAATASYDTIHNPIEVTNAGAFTERWAVVFTNATEFYLMGEHLGIVASGNTATDFAPVNPSSNTPYMTIRAAGWGAGWSVGNVLRINTIGAIVPIWQVLTCQMGVLTNTQFNPSTQIRGNVDRP